MRTLPEFSSIKNLPGRMWVQQFTSACLLLLTLLLFVSQSLVPGECFGIPYPHLWERDGHTTNLFSFHETDADTSQGYDVLSMDISLEIHPEQRLFSGNVTILVVPETDTLSVLQIHHLNNQEDICWLDGNLAEVAHHDDYLEISLPDEYQLSDTFTVQITWNGVCHASNFGGGMIYHEPQDVVYTFGEPYLTRKWLPCYDLPFDKVTSRMSVLMDSRFDVLSNGEFVEQIDNEDGTSETIWQNDDPISTYLISIAAAEYDYVESGIYGVHDVPVNFWVYPEKANLAIYELQRTGEMLEYFETLFGPYVLNKYDQAMAPIFNGWGAMEHQTCTTYGMHLIDTGNRFYEGIVAHELAHQWWGDIVTPFTFAHIWLNEGFASYSDALWGEYISIERRNEIMEDFSRRYFDEVSDPDRGHFPIFNPEHNPEPLQFDPMFSATIYYKGAWVLHMLRWTVGDEAFFNGFREHLHQHQFGNSTIQEFIATMQSQTGEDLEPFFDQWVFQSGYPVYSFRNFTVEPIDGEFQVTIELTQEQASPLFSTTLPLRVFNAEQDTILRVQVEPLSLQQLDLGLFGFEPTGYEFDPERWILCGNHNNGVGGNGAGCLPAEAVVTPAWPNPFNSTTRFDIVLQARSLVTTDIYSILGRRIIRLEHRMLESGIHSRSFSTDNLGMATGMYLLKVQVGSEHFSRKLILQK